MNDKNLDKNGIAEEDNRDMDSATEAWAEIMILQVESDNNKNKTNEKDN